MAVTPTDTEYVRTRSTATVGSGRNLLDVKALKMHFPLTQGIIFQRQGGAVRAADGIDFFVEKRETLRPVGGSRCGKSPTRRGVLPLFQPTPGQVKVYGTEPPPTGRAQTARSPQHTDVD